MYETFLCLTQISPNKKKNGESKIEVKPKEGAREKGAKRAGALGSGANGTGGDRGEKEDGGRRRGAKQPGGGQSVEKSPKIC